LSKHNYSQYSNKNTNKPTVNTEPSRVETAPVETLGYTGDIIEPAPVKTLEYIEEKTETITVPVTIFGTVTNCTRLNVRVAPNPNATVACVLNADSEIEIDSDKSTTEWYSVCTAAGIKGYCMRKFITTRT
jgi:hypothetical protein